MNQTKKRQPKVIVKPVKHQPPFHPPMVASDTQSLSDYSSYDYSSEEDSVEPAPKKPSTVSRQPATRSLPNIGLDKAPTGSVGFKKLAPVIASPKNTPNKSIAHPLWQKMALECAAQCVGIMAALYMPAAYINLLAGARFSTGLVKYAIYNCAWATARFIGMHLSIEPKGYTAWSRALFGQAVMTTAGITLYDKGAALLEKIRLKI